MIWPGRHQIGMVAAMRLEWVAAFVGIRNLRECFPPQAGARARPAGAPGRHVQARGAARWDTPPGGSPPGSPGRRGRHAALHRVPPSPNWKRRTVTMDKDRISGAANKAKGAVKD